MQRTLQRGNRPSPAVGARPPLVARGRGCSRISRAEKSWFRDGLLRRGSAPCAPKQDPSLYLKRLSIFHVPFELPLAQSVGDRFCLIGEGAEKVNVLHRAIFSDDDSDGNGVEHRFR